MFIILYDDDQGLCCPLGWDDECEGAVVSWSDHIAVFSSLSR